MGANASWTGFAVLGLVLLVLLPPAMGCGGGGGGTAPACAPPLYDLSGTWEITEEEPSNTCGDPVPPPETEIFTVTQSGNTVTAVGSSGTRVFQLCGDTVVVPGRSYPEDGGVTTVPAYSATFTNPNSWSGSTTWAWTDGVTTCSGVTMITATRL